MKSVLSASFRDEAALAVGLEKGRSFPGALLLFDDLGRMGTASLVMHEGKQVIFTAYHNIARLDKESPNIYVASLGLCSTPIIPYLQSIPVDKQVMLKIDIKRLKSNIIESGGELKLVRTICEISD